MKIVYRTSSYGKRIEKLKAERETDHSVWVEGRRYNKRSSWYNHFDSFEEAKQYLLNKAVLNVESLERQLKNAKEELEKIRVKTENNI